jgi:hypothetical protein
VNESQSQKTNSTKPQEKPKLESYTKYDFIPGDKFYFMRIFHKMPSAIFPLYGHLIAVVKSKK